MKDDSLYLIHILECIGRIERYTEGIHKTRGDPLTPGRALDGFWRSL